MDLSSISELNNFLHRVKSIVSTWTNVGFTDNNELCIACTSVKATSRSIATILMELLDDTDDSEDNSDSGDVRQSFYNLLELL
jgi:hypothetical protein